MLLETKKDDPCYYIMTENWLNWTLQLYGIGILAGQLAEEISKQSIKAAIWFLLAAYHKCRRKEIEEGTIKEKEKALDHLGGSQSIQIAKNTKIKKLSVGNACCGKAKCLTRQPFAVQV